MFQSTRPRGARHQRWFSRTGVLGFNPRARVGRDTQRFDNGAINGRFQSTRPRGARPSMSTATRKEKRSFNPRARVGRDAWAAYTAA